MSIVDDGTAVQNSVALGRGRALPFSAYFGTLRTAGAAAAEPQHIKLSDEAYDVGLFAGIMANVAGSGLRWDMGLLYQAQRGGPAVTLSADENAEALGVYGALRYDFGLAAVTASLSYAPHGPASGKSPYAPMLAAEVPIGQVFTLSAGISPSWTNLQTAPNTVDATDWGVAGTVNLLGFDVSLSYAEFGAAGETSPETRALFRVQRAF